MADILDIDLRHRNAAMQRHSARHAPHLSQNLRQLGAANHFVPTPPAHLPPMIVRGWFGNVGKTSQHLNYMQQGKGWEGAHSRLFGPQGMVMDPTAFLSRAATDPHQFRMAVSPSEAYKDKLLPWQPYIELWMARVERDLQRPLDWVAAIHRDTDRPHAHVVLRGKDRQGKDLYIAKDYLSHGLRYRAMTLAATMLGLDRARQREMTPARTITHTIEQKHGRDMGI